MATVVVLIVFSLKSDSDFARVIDLEDAKVKRDGWCSEVDEKRLEPCGCQRDTDSPSYSLLEQ